MKKEITVLTLDSGKGIKIIVILLMLFSPLIGEVLQDYKINDIHFVSDNGFSIKDVDKYKNLIDFKQGDHFSYKDVKKSMENLFKMDFFSDVEVRVEKLVENRLNVYFILTKRYTVYSIDIVKDISEKKRALKGSIRSLRKNTFFEKDQIKKGLDEIKAFLESRGYLNPGLDYKIKRDESKSRINIVFFIKGGEKTVLKKVDLKVNNSKILEKLKSYFKQQKYIPYKIQKYLEKVKKILKKHKYYSPVIDYKVSFFDDSRSQADLYINIDVGFKYIFEFNGIKNKYHLISSIWEKKRFEKWAEKESRARIKSFLIKNGYLNAEVESNIVTKDMIKHITFTVKKNKRYKLGKINFKGNSSVPTRELRKIVRTDESLFNKFLWLRSESLVVDKEVMKAFYHFKGFPLSEINMEPSFHQRRVDINFVINEGKRYTVDSILFDGNNRFKTEELHATLKIKESDPFVQQKFSEDLDKLKKFYHSYGFDDVDISFEISPGNEISVLIRIKEGNSFKMGDLIIIGASTSQRKLIKKLFLLKQNSYFDRNKIERFKNEIENSSIFNEIKIIRIKKELGLIDLLVKVIPDRSRYYGFGIGWEDREETSGKDFFTRLINGSRGTFEYQERNVFNTYSSFSGIIQLGFAQRRGVISYDTPYFSQNNISSSFKIWNENEEYPSFTFNRFGFGESIIKRVTSNAYLLAFLSWYRTDLTKLRITESGVDRLEPPFDTTALTLSYVVEKRDDPFNPSTGDYFSTDIKFGFPLLEKNYSFIKFKLSYQKNFKFLKQGNLSFSLRSGLASGDMSITERFFAGGIHSFRGVSYDRLGPLEIKTENNKEKIYPRGGNALFLLNVEASFPIPVSSSSDLFYCIFTDVGNVFNRVSDFHMREMRSAVGFGIKYKTPLGPLKVTFAWSFGYKKEERDFKILWGIGNVF